MKKIILFLLFNGLLIFTFSACGENKNQKFGDDSTKSNAVITASVDGNLLYENYCISCHGDDGAAGTMGAADLSSSKIDHVVAVAIIKSGRNGMRSFRVELNDAQIEAVAKYIETLRK